MSGSNAQPTPEGKPEPSDTARLDPRFSELSDQLRTAQAEIGQIQLQRLEQKRPWWRQTAILISIVSLLVSSSFSIYTAVDQRHQRKTAALDSRLADIVSLRMEDARQSAALASSSLSTYRTWSTAAVVKRAMLVDALVAAVRDLRDNISSTAALAVSAELIQDGRYVEAEKIVNVGLKAASAAHTSTGALTSMLAQVYMLQGSPFYHPTKGRELYTRAIDSFSNQVDFSGLNNQLSLILFWAAAEAGLGNAKEAAHLIQIARKALADSPLPAGVKAPLAGVTDNLANQIRQASVSSLYDPSRLLGNWRVFDSENKSSALIIAMPAGASVPTFARDQVEAGVLTKRVNGTIFLTDSNHMRLDWNGALVVNRGSPTPLAGYSEVRLNSDGTLRGVDYSLGWPSIRWTARRIPTQ